MPRLRFRERLVQVGLSARAPHPRDENACIIQASPDRRPAEGDGRKARRRALRALVVLAAGAILVALVSLFRESRRGSEEATEGGAPPPEDPRKTAETDLLSGKSFYLVLDPEARSVRLMLKGALLDEYPVEEIRVGAPRILFFSQESQDDWTARIWADGRLDPPRTQKRIEYTPPDSALALDSLQPALPIPPTAEEAYHVPPVYRVRFRGGLTLVVESAPDSTAQGKPSGVEVVWSRLAERARAFFDSFSGGRGRVLLCMRAEDAQRLYRSLPPGSCFLVAPRAPATDG
ncbi:MAG: hypothetical protein ABIH26_02965 [Candidatus Eisenbacteria bacterium]